MGVSGKSGSSKPGIPTPGTQAEPEKRRDLRVPLRVLRVESEHNGEIFAGYATNLSTSGIFIQTTNPKKPGTRITIQFTLPTKQKIAGLAEVVWTREYTGKEIRHPGMGMRFLELGPEHSEFIRTFLEEK